MNKNVCNNCGKSGHIFYQCTLPITSYGIILFRVKENKLQFLMIRRKDSFGYIDFIRGKYSPHNICQLQKIIDEMSIDEKKRILEFSFDQLWEKMWGNVINSQYKNEELISSKKMDLIRNGIKINNETITLQEIIEKSNTSWVEPEWEFPKGRRNNKEKDVDCALREFEEETGIFKNKISIIENIIPFEETFIGTNYKSYKHKYYLAYIDNIEYNLEKYQVAEVSKIEWKTIDECLLSIRPYNLEKKKLITDINKVLKEYRLYV